MRFSPNFRRAVWFLATLGVLAGLFIFTALRFGPLARVNVTLAKIQTEALSPVLSGIGTVEARYRFKIGPTHTGRVLAVAVDVGEQVKKGQVLGLMDPVDLDARIASQASALGAMQSRRAMAESQVAEAQAQLDYASNQLGRYRELAKTHAVSQEAHDSAVLRQRAASASLETAQAAVIAATRDETGARATLNALERQKQELSLMAPVDGLIVNRRIEPGSTAMAGEAVFEMIDPRELWVHLRLNQLEAEGLSAGLPSQITLRSRVSQVFAGHVIRVEPLADAVTEELLAKVHFETLPDPLPPLGELVEVEIQLPAEPASVVVPAAAVQRHDGRLGVWLIADDHPRFAAVRVGRRSANGMIQILEGLADESGEVIVHSTSPLSARTRLRITDSLNP